MRPIKESYLAARRRFEARLIKMIRSKARANRVKLPSPKTVSNDELTAFLYAVLFPGLSAVNAQRKQLELIPLMLQNGFSVSPTVRATLRLCRVPANQMAKRATGYGSKAVSKAFWGRMKEAQWINRVMWTYVLRTWLPVDYAQRLLTMEEVATYPIDHFGIERWLTKVLKAFTAKRVMNILAEKGNADLIKDAAKDLEFLHGRADVPKPIDLSGHDTITSLHDHLSRRRRLIVEPDFELRAARQAQQRVEWDAKRKAETEKRLKGKAEIDELLSKVDGMTISADIMEKGVDGRGQMKETLSYTLVVPKTAHEMQSWGNDMSNCIGGYARQVADGWSVILGLVADGKCHWGVEIGLDSDGRSIRQFRGRFNESPPAELNVTVAAKLTEMGLIMNSDHKECLDMALHTVQAYDQPVQMAEPPF